MWFIIVYLVCFMPLIYGMSHRPPTKPTPQLPLIKLGLKKKPRPLRPKPPKKSQPDLTINPNKEVLPEISTSKKTRLASELSPILVNHQEIEAAAAQFAELQKIIIESLEHLQEYPYVPIQDIFHSLKLSKTYLPNIQKRLLDVLQASTIKLEITQESMHHFLENEINGKIRQLVADRTLPQRGALVEPIEKFLKKLNDDRRLIIIYKKRLLRKKFPAGAGILQKEEFKQTHLPAISKYQLPPVS